MLTIFAWIYQIFCVIGIIMWIVMGGVVLFGIHNPDFRAGFEEGMGIKGVSVAGYTIISIIDYIIFITHRTWFAKSSNNVLYPSGVTTGLLFLAVLYVVYLVFKYGMKVQEDADSII